MQQDLIRRGRMDEEAMHDHRMRIADEVAIDAGDAEVDAEVGEKFSLGRTVRDSLKEAQQADPSLQDILHHLDSRTSSRLPDGGGGSKVWQGRPHRIRRNSVRDQIM